MSKNSHKPNAGQQKQGSAKPVAAPKSPLSTKPTLGAVPVPPTRPRGWLESAKDAVDKTQADKPAPEPFFTYQMKVFIPEGVLDIYGTTPQTKAEIQAKYEAVRDFGAVFNTKDGGWTTYMPKTIAKIIVVLTPYTGGSGENQ